MRREEIKLWFEEVLMQSLPSLKQLLREEIERIQTENMGLVYVPKSVVEYTSYARQLMKGK